MTFSAQSITNVDYFSEAPDFKHNMAVRAVNSLGLTYYTYFDVTILPLKTISAPPTATYYYKVGDPVTLDIIAGAYTVDIPTAESWTYTLAGALGPITTTDHSTSENGVDFHVYTLDDNDASVYTLTVTA